MSEESLPLRQWPAAIQQASVPANENALRVQALLSRALSVENDAPGTEYNGAVYIVGSAPTGAFANFSEHDIALFEFGSWYAWAPPLDTSMVINDVRKVFDGTEWIDDPAGGGGGTGDVTGPVSSVAGNLALFADATGKVIEDGGTPGDMAFIDDAASDGTGYVRKNGAWVAESGGGGGGMTNPMTTAGDIIYGGSSGTPTRLAAGTNGDVLTLAAGVPTWAAGGGGGGLTNWTDAISTSTPNATVPVVSLLATNAAVNVDGAIVPKGTGALLAQVPDGVAAAGNKRGNYAVDFQRLRSNAAAVASGNTSFIGNGNGNTASGSYSFIGNGESCSASGAGAAVVSGQSNTANADYSWIPGGRNAQTRAILGAGARAAGMFSVQGDAQSMCLVLRRATTNATTTHLTADASGGGLLNQLNLPNNSAYLVKGSIVAREAATGDSKTWDFTCHIKRGANAAATSVVAGGTPTVIGADAGAASWAAAVVADTSNGCFRVEVTGEASKNIKWVCDIYSAVQVVG